MNPIFFPPLPNDERFRMALHGAWRYAANAGDGTPAVALPAESATAQIPGEFVMQGLPYHPTIPAVVEREFVIPADWAGMHIRLRIEAIYAECDVWLDGHQIGGHTGAFTPFDLDLTGIVQPTASHRLTLIIRHDSLANMITFGSDYADHPITGVLRPVTLYALPTCHIRRLHAAAGAPHADGVAALTIEVEVAQMADLPCAGAILELVLHDPQGCPIILQPESFVVPPLAAGALWTQSMVVDILGAVAWDPEHPRLYALEVRLIADTAPQRVVRRIGCRDVAVVGRQLVVNGRPVKLRGINRHDAHPRYGRAIPDGLARQDVELLKAAHVNFIRTSHYPPSVELVEACDALGIFLEVEAPVCFTFGMFGKTPAWESLTQEQQVSATAIVVDNVRRMIEAYRSHPSVILWSIGNESCWASPFVDSAHAAHAADPLRPLIFNWERYRDLDVGFCEIGAEHYPPSGDLAAYAALQRPILFDEYCHLPVYNRDELETDPGLHELWGACLLSQWDAIYALPNGLGGSIWAGIDDLFLVPTSTGVRVGGYGSWGPIDGWRRAKPELWHVAQVYAPIRLPRHVALRAGEVITLPIENRCDFTDLAELRIDWRLGAHAGRCVIELPPHTAGELHIPAIAAADTALQVTITDPRGIVLLTHTVVLQIETMQPLPAHKNQMPPAALRVDADAYWFETHNGHWRLDRQDGRLSADDLHGRRVVLSGPTLALIPRDQAYLDPDRRSRRYTVDELCSDWRCTQVAPAEDDPQQIVVRGSYREAAAEFQIGLDADGLLCVNYCYTPYAALVAWQIGLAFTLDATYDTLTWQREGLWADYPADHIGRPSGTARAYRPTDRSAGTITEQPMWPWALDQNMRGTHDFRSTKYAIHAASLTARHSGGLQCVSNGGQHVRAAVMGDTIRLLCLDHADIGSEYFLQSFVERRIISAGVEQGGCVRLRVL